MRVLKFSSQVPRVLHDHIDKWFHLENDSMHINFTLLRDQIVEYKEVVDLAKQLNLEMAIMNELYAKVLFLNILFKKIPVDVLQKKKAEKKWMNIFSKNNSFLLIS